MTIKKHIKSEEKKNNEESRKSANIPDANFVAPDGGWGWMIVVAAGCSNGTGTFLANFNDFSRAPQLSIFPILQSFGLVFRDRFVQLGINASQVTTIMNVSNAVTACIGLANGPLFRKYSYRQVLFVGGMISGVSMCALSFAKTFQTILLFHSILYSAGVGISMSSCALALNTYFKKRRRIATGLSWTCTGLGPIITPQIITILMPIYGMPGTVLIYGGVAFNALACALLLQPVEQHAKKLNKRDKVEDGDGRTDILKEKSETTNGNAPITNGKAFSVESIVHHDKLGSLVDNRLSQRFGSQYLYYEDEGDGAKGIDVMTLETPMMSLANDGWFSRKYASHTSLTSRKDSISSRRPSLSLSRQASLKALSRGNSVRNLSRQSSEVEAWKKKITSQSNPAARIAELSESEEHKTRRQNAECIMSNEDDETEHHLLGPEEAWKVQDITEEKMEISRTWYSRALHAIVVFFDLDLLRDPIYVNLMLGITFANFTEMNFALLTPFILADYGMETIQVATIMSVLAGVDILMRITIPFVASKLDWENRTFFLIGVGSMAAGRIVIAHVESYGIIMAVSVLIGAGKALRTIFIALVIPTHVPLEKLPGASGLQLVTSGLVFLMFGPLVGWIRDTSGDYTTTLHCLNVLTYLTIISWSLEVWYFSRKRKMVEKKTVAPI